MPIKVQIMLILLAIAGLLGLAGNKPAGWLVLYLWYLVLLWWPARQKAATCDQHEAP
jgi:hypothetical protein